MFLAEVVVKVASDGNVDQPGKVAIPARGQLNRENGHFHVPVRA